MRWADVILRLKKITSIHFIDSLKIEQLAMQV